MSDKTELFFERFTLVVNLILETLFHYHVWTFLLIYYSFKTELAAVRYSWHREITH